MHLDGDRKYSEKSSQYYNKIGLNAIVKNIEENRQSKLVIPLLNKYNPDILLKYLNDLADLDIGIKTGEKDKELALELFILSL